jgi:hypothetical protein
MSYREMTEEEEKLAAEEYKKIFNREKLDYFYYVIKEKYTSRVRSFDLVSRRLQGLYTAFDFLNFIHSEKPKYKYTIIKVEGTDPLLGWTSRELEEMKKEKAND